MMGSRRVKLVRFTDVFKYFQATKSVSAIWSMHEAMNVLAKVDQRGWDKFAAACQKKPLHGDTEIGEALVVPPFWQFTMA